MPTLAYCRARRYIAQRPEPEPGSGDGWTGGCPVAASVFSRNERSIIMNTDQIKGTAKDIAGKVQEGVGKAVDSKEQQAKGLEKQVEGKTQKTVGDAKDIVKGD